MTECAKSPAALLEPGLDDQKKFGSWSENCWEVRYPTRTFSSIYWFKDSVSFLSSSHTAPLSRRHGQHFFGPKEVPVIFLRGNSLMVSWFAQHPSRHSSYLACPLFLVSHLIRTFHLLKIKAGFELNDILKKRGWNSRLTKIGNSNVCIFKFRNTTYKHRHTETAY